MSYIGNWAKPKIFIHEFFNCWVLFAEGDVHLDCALAVAEIVDCLVGNVVYVFEYCW